MRRRMHCIFTTIVAKRCDCCWRRRICPTASSTHKNETKIKNKKVWLLLEEKKMPYRIEHINMRSYGDKPDWFNFFFCGRLSRKVLDVVSAYSACIYGRPTRALTELTHY
jgi:hypothetical protein